MTEIYPEKKCLSGILKKYSLLFLLLSLSGCLFAQPVINSFSPASGPVGTKVTISGKGFSMTAANNIVYFGAVKAPVSFASDTSLTVTAPAGASYQPITVTSNSLTAFAPKPFIITFSGGGNAFSASSFSPHTEYPAGVYTPSIVDLDGDGRPDLVSANQTGTLNSLGFSEFSTLRNTGTSGSVSFGPRVDFATTSNPAGSYVGDLDGDGKPDVLISNVVNHSPAISIFRNTSTAGSISFTPAADYPTQGFDTFPPHTILVRDLDGDGKPDFISENIDSTITVYRNNSTPGSISFTKAGVYVIADSRSVDMVTGDLDGDGKPDIVVLGEEGGLFFFRNTSQPGSISFAPRSAYTSFNSNEFNFYALAIGDLDGDGKPDLAFVSTAYNMVSAIRNTSSIGSISFGQEVDYPTGEYPDAIAIGDLDGDGKPEIAVANQFDLSVSVYRNTCAKNTLTFDQGVAFGVSSDPSSSTDGIAIGDVDGDGKADIVVTNEYSSTVSILRNQMASLPPVVRSMSPDSAATGAVISIYGYHFGGISSVTLGGAAVQSFAVISDSVVTAIVGAGANGNLVVTGPGGADTLAGFIFLAAAPPVQPPRISSFSPDSAGALSTVTIRGQHLSGIASVSFGGTTAQSFHLVSDSVITAVVGSGSTGQVFVTTSGGAMDSLKGFVFIDSTTNPNPPPPQTPPPADTSFQLTGFSGSPASGKVLLQWQAINERTIGYYVVEHSSDSSQFTAITSIQPRSRDTAIQSYSYTDANPGPGINYYRLKIEDTAGRYTYGPVIAIQFGGAPLTLTLHPNPANTSLTVLVPNGNIPSQFQLVDLSGQVLRVIPVSQNTQEVTINLTGILEGVYKLIWRDGINYSYKTVLILR